MTLPEARIAAFLARPALSRLLAVLDGDGEEARIIGGAVRDLLLGEAVGDVDLATTALPEETMRRGREAGFKVVPTGLEHGTITLIVEGAPFEVTTLREDVETDGRHATVRFGRDFEAMRGGATSRSMRSRSTGPVSSTTPAVGSPISPRGASASSATRDAHSRGLSAHPAVLPLPRPLRERRARCRRRRRLRRGAGRAGGVVTRACARRADEASGGAGRGSSPAGHGRSRAPDADDRPRAASGPLRGRGRGRG